MPGDVLRIGLLGAVIGAALGLLSLIPLLGCLALPLALILYIGIGVFAALRLPSPRSVGQGAGAGAITGALAGFGYGLVLTVTTPLMFTLTGGAEAMIQGLPPQLMEMYRQAGVDPQLLFNPLMVTFSAGLCCIGGVVLAAILGAISGAIAAAAASG